MLHTQHTQNDRITTNHKSQETDQQDPEKVNTLSDPPLRIESENKSIPQEDLINYMYKHIQFDEIPFESDPLYDHRQIYSHDMLHIPYGLYENIQSTIAFDIAIENEEENAQIQDTNTAYMHNIGRPISLGHSTSNNEIRREVYNEEQNEILRMNIENTLRNNEKEKMKQEKADNTHNMDMSQQAPSMPVYMPIVDEHHGVMFPNSSKALKREQYQHSDEIENNTPNDVQYMLHSVNDAEMFQYNDTIEGENIPMVEATYFTTEKAQKFYLMGTCMQ